MGYLVRRKGGTTHKVYSCGYQTILLSDTFISCYGNYVFQKYTCSLCVGSGVNQHPVCSSLCEVVYSLHCRLYMWRLAPNTEYTWTRHSMIWYGQSENTRNPAHQRRTRKERNVQSSNLNIILILK